MLQMIRTASSPFGESMWIVRARVPSMATTKIPYAIPKIRRTRVSGFLHACLRLFIRLRFVR